MNLFNLAFYAVIVVGIVVPAILLFVNLLRGEFAPSNVIDQFRRGKEDAEE